MSACAPAPLPWTSDSPSGAIDAVARVANTVTVSGWAGDRNTANPIEVVFFVNAKLVDGRTRADAPRPDVLAATGRAGTSGFSRQLTVPAGTALSCVSAINVGAGESTSLGCRNVVMPLPAPPAPVIPRCNLPAAPNVDWSGCDLTNRNLTNANLSHANLQDATMVGVRLDGANLSNADAAGTNFSAALADTANLNGTRAAGANFANSTIRTVDFNGADLETASFAGANITSSTFDNTHLSQAKFTTTSIAGSTFTSA